MFLPAPGFHRTIFSGATQAQLIAAGLSRRAFACQLLALLLTYALLLQLVPRVVLSAPSGSLGSSLEKQAVEIKHAGFSSQFIQAGANGWSELLSAISAGSDVSGATLTDAVVLRHKPTFNSGRIEGTLRVLLGESFTINSGTDITSDLYLPGTPTIQLRSGAQYGGTISDGGAAAPDNYTVTLAGGVNLPGRIHDHADAITLPSDFPVSIPAPAATRTANVHSPSDVTGIGNWQTVRDLNVTSSHLALDVPPGNYGTFTINGNSQLNFTAGTYNFSNTFNLDGGARLRATGLVTINIAQNLIINSGAVVLGSYTSPADVHLNVLGSLLSINGSSQVSGLIRAYNGTVILKGRSQVRGQVIADNLTLSGGTVIGAVWPAQTGNGLTVFGPRRFARTTGSPNQYVEQFALPAGATSPYTLHIQNGEPGGSNRISSATVKLNGIDVLRPNDLDQNVAGLDRTVTLAANNQLDVRLESEPGSYLIIDISGAVPARDTTPPTIAISSPANNSTTTATQTTVSGTAMDAGQGASGVAHVYLNNSQAAYNSADGTWTISGVSLALGANQITASAIDQAGNETTTSINVSRESPTNLAPAVHAGSDQTLTLPQTALLNGTATDDGLPDESTLTTTWIMVSGPGTVTFADSGALDTQASFSSAGTYVLGLTATDSALSTTDDLTITVQPQNQPPTVSAGPDQTMALPHTATLNGTVTDDGLPEAGTLAITWSQVSGPGTVTFEDQNLPDTTATFSAAGTYLLRLTASDTELTSKSDVTITVQPENQAPTVSAGADQIISLPGVAQLNGVASDDGWPAGSTLSVSWNFLSGPGPVSFDNPNATITIARFGLAGTYLLRLTASDGELSSSDDLIVTVMQANQAPTVSAGPDQTITAAPRQVLFFDDFESGPGQWMDPGSMVLSTTSAFSGTHSQTFGRVGGAGDARSTFIPVNPGQTYNLRGAYMTLGGGGFFGVENFNASYQYQWHTWLFGDGSDGAYNTWPYYSINNTPPSELGRWRLYDQAYIVPAGIYFLRIITEDWSGGLPNDPINHGVFFDNIELSTYATPQTNLTGSVSDDGLPTATALTIAWTMVSGPGAVTFGNPTQAATTAAFSTAGIYVLRLAAGDSVLASSDEMTVTVLPANQQPKANAGPEQTITLANNPANLNGTVVDDALPAGATLLASWSVVNTKQLATLAPLIDDFNNNLFDTLKWGVLQLTGSGTQLLERNQRLELLPGAAGGSGLFRSNGYTDVRGRTISFKYGGYTPSQQTSRFTVRDDGAATTIWADIINGQISFLSDSFFDGQTRHDGNFAYNGSAPIWLRWRQAGSQFFWDTSTDGTSWTNRLTGNLFRAATSTQFVKFNFASNPGLPVLNIDDFSSNCASFSRLSGPGAVSFSNANETATTATFSDVGIYLLRLTASDSELTDLSDTLVTVHPANQAPTVSVGPNRILTLPNVLSLDASLNDDGYPLGSTLTQTWSKQSGPGVVTFSPNAAITSANFSVAGVYVLRFAANDSAFTSLAELTVNVNPPCPSPSCAPSVALTSPANNTSFVAGSSITLTATATDSDGQISKVEFFSNGVKLGETSTSPFTFLWSNVAAGSYSLQAKATDNSGATATSDLVAIMVTGPPNQPPVVSAGADQTIDLPAVANLQGTVSDDGQPTNTVTASWSKVSGPGNVTFGNDGAATTTATFVSAGTYVLRLTASDTDLSASDDVQITVNPVNQAPTANAGPDQTVSMQANLIANSGNEDLLVGGEIPGWTEVQGTIWGPGSTNSGSGFPEAQRGTAYFYSGNTAQAELRQDVDLSAYAANIAAGTQQFEFKTYVRSLLESVPDAARVILEYRGVTNSNVVASLDSGLITSTTGWHLTEDTRTVPAGTGWIRIRLLATRNSGTTNDAFFDSVSLRPVGNVAVRLNGVATDDGLPAGSSVSTTWTTISGPAAVTFATPNAAATGAAFTTPGTYVLRLTSSDGQANTSDDVTVVVNPANQAPLVNAGTNQTITLPATATLNGSVTDDGQPPGSAVSVAWSKVSGPGIVAFANANAATTTATFSTPGIYALRLTADDTEYSASADVTLTINPAPNNQPPTVSAGADQTISQPTDTVTLNGTVADDGLPVGSTLSVHWATVSGPGTVTFGNANSAVTTAQFSATGNYVLHLTASDSAFSASDDVNVVFTPANQAPTANAGADQTILLSQAVQLNGTVNDDGLPAGSGLTTSWTTISGTGTVTFGNSNATVTGAQFSATGTYVLRLTASDGQLSQSDDLIVTVNDNVAPPTVQITAPADGHSVTEPTIVTGSVSGGSWQLEYSLASDDNTNNRVWITLPGGNGAVTNSQLGTLDPTMMLNGLFTIRLSATDGYGQISRTSISIIVERNLKIGNFTVSFSDLNIPVAGVPMEVTRTYDSRDKRAGDFGFGWTLGLRNIRLEKSGVLGFKWYETVSQEAFPSYCLQATGSHVVTVTFPGGKVFKFQAVVTPECQRFAPITAGTVSFIPMPGTNGTLGVMDSADFQVEGSVPGPVNLIGFGGGVDIFNSFVFKFTAEDGTAYVIDQRTGLQSIADTNNNTVTVSAGGIIHSNGKSITFTRDSLGRISQIADPNGNAQTYRYDASGDLVSYTDTENNTSTYTYDTMHRLLTIHDPRGIQPIRNDYDPDGRLLSHTDGFGKVITYIHDLLGRVETVTDRLGHSTSFEYDEHGNVLRKTDARGGVTAFTYDANDNVLTETNALGKTTAYTYDANDHRTAITDPAGNVTQFTYNALGKLLTTTDPLGHITSNTYNAAGNLLTTKDPLNNITSFTYSVFDGQRTSMTDALTNTTRYDYASGYLTKETDALGHETTFTYDANGNRTSQTIKRTNAQGQLEVTTSYEYDKLSGLKKTIFADGSFTQVEYNSLGQQGATIDQLGHRTEFTYDDMGRLTRNDYPDGTHEEITYDSEGRRLASRDRAGHLTSYAYDELGRLTKTTYSDGTFTSSTYDVAGQVLSITDARGNVTHYEYDNAGRRTKVTNALNQETAFAYDADGNQLSMTDALGRATTYEYDLNNRRTRTTYADSTFDRVGYDVLGRSVSKTDPAGKTTEFTYDELGRLTKVKDALNQETTFAYNEPGQQISQTDANNHTTRFEYDQLGRRVKRILPGDQFEIYSYDNGGNLASRTGFNGKTTAFNYDVMRRLLSKVPDESLNEASISFTYNILGQRATMNDASGTTVYTYDARNRLSSKQTPFGTLSYTYNEGGNLLTTRSSNANGVSLDYSYDALNRLVTVEDNQLAALNGGVTSYSDDTVGNLQSYSYPNGVTSSYTYNSLNRLTAMAVATTTSALAGYSYTLGAAGNRTAVTELGGRTDNYTYDALYRLTGESIANDPQGVNGSITYSYDAVGNRLNRTSSVGPVPSQSSSYDVNDRLASESYDNNGNTTTANGNSYVYDFENHLTSLNDGSVTYVYDGDGNRVAKTVGGVTTNYLVDTNNPTGYAQVVEELHAGSVVKSFTYGHELISQRIVGGSLSFYGYDGHGSVRLLTDANGTVTDTYDYDAFGNLISRTGTTSNDYLYSGEQFDEDLGFYYLRARYLNPSSGRFWTQDSFAGSRYDPISLHKYLYADADPVNRLDPSGQFSLLDTVITSTTIGAVSGFGLGFLTGGLQGAVRGAFHGALLGALIPLTGAGVGYALLGNAARGVFIVGWGVGFGNAGVSGFSLATATTGEERFEAGVGLVATVGFMFVGPKVLERVNTRVISGEQANADFLAHRGGVGERPWNPPDSVTETTLFRAAKYVRVFVQGRNSPAGAWVMEASEIEGMTMSEIQQKFALPFTPSHITAVTVPAGTTIRVGTAGENAFGPGGGMQVEIQKPN